MESLSLPYHYDYYYCIHRALANIVVAVVSHLLLAFYLTCCCCCWTGRHPSKSRTLNSRECYCELCRY